MNMKAIFTVEFEADDDGANAQYFLEQALARARAALKNSIEQGWVDRPASGRVSHASLSRVSQDEVGGRGRGRRGSQH
jgi:hypothetical protein